jgi:hypothetical protein
MSSSMMEYLPILISLGVLLAVSLDVLSRLTPGRRSHRLGATFLVCVCVVLFGMFMLKALGESLISRIMWHQFLTPSLILAVAAALLDLSRASACNRRRNK